MNQITIHHRGEVVTVQQAAEGTPMTDYTKLNKVVKRQRAALTRAVKTGDPAKIEAVCRTAVAEWNAGDMMWPDDWSRWQRALDDAYPVFHAPRLEDL